MNVEESRNLLICFLVLFNRLRRKKLFKNEHLKLSIKVVFPEQVKVMNNMIGAKVKIPESILPKIFNFILRNGCFVGANCSINTDRLSYSDHKGEQKNIRGFSHLPCLMIVVIELFQHSH